ncbi:MAG TPA: NAD(P)(+) transhydrogenase (Re/Si-specific) subunit beta [Dinghuibacter sp.]|uniref:NAD(P)(+) transhydrogenase (Re/Si-specific) subunit beta n=1 Tax=Dinghuibacter sp. TaxID=2024697 RepID=UPI002C96664D|nr:NAD(P)(+) transhydrogenase (Re/Si-specific) subunit beta [Dinghuibacter sp.]HTJ12726.1 NAD(P)(+) transhydrogenase (Re/Si-specific) subunit beta [Dinghuibacter sp.]
MTALLPLCYILGSITFIVGLKMMSHPSSARTGNAVAAAGMTVAIVGTLFLYRNGGHGLHNYGWIFSGLILGGVFGVLAARKVKMTAMPEMVSLFNGMGGACAALISIAEYRHSGYAGPFTLAGLVIGSISFAGSIVAWGKLSGKVKDFAFPGQHVFNIAIFLVLVGAAIYTGAAGTDWLFYAIAGLSLVYGVLFVLPIGGADMPVVISLLNSFTGVAAACGGFLYHNPVMLTGGILVGSAGTILTILMCKAMNRSLTNVLVGSFGGAAAGRAGATGGAYKEMAQSDAAVVLAYAREVMIVPGYGLAVAQAQHACHELERVLGARGVNVQYAIHPVAGRMPGHMNVLLAEADVSYDRLLEMESANDLFAHTDVVLVLGANDVVNPAAKTDPSSPIYGMPILEVEKAKLVIVNKRSMKPGYAGIENQLFFQPKTSMLFGDAKGVLQQLIGEIKALG